MRPGDLVVVRKAGDVIPEVVGPVRRGPGGPKRRKPQWNVPDDLPVVRQPWCACAGESDTYCTNIDCPAQRVQRIVHFASRSAMDIEGLGEQRVVQLVEAGLIADPADLYGLRSASSAQLERFGPSSRRPTCWRHRGVQGPPAQPAAGGSGHPPCRARPAPGPWPGPSGRSTPSWRPTPTTLAAVEGIGP